MSFQLGSEIPKSSQELDDLLKDVSALLADHQRLSAENKQLKDTLLAKDGAMQVAQKRLLNLLKRLPTQV